MNAKLLAALLAALLVGGVLGNSQGRSAGEAAAAAKYDEGRVKGCTSAFDSLGIPVGCAVEGGDLYAVGEIVRGGKYNLDKKPAPQAEEAPQE